MRNEKMRRRLQARGIQQVSATSSQVHSSSYTSSSSSALMLLIVVLTDSGSGHDDDDASTHSRLRRGRCSNVLVCIHEMCKQFEELFLAELFVGAECLEDGRDDGREAVACRAEEKHEHDIRVHHAASAFGSTCLEACCCDHVHDMVRADSRLRAHLEQLFDRARRAAFRCRIHNFQLVVCRRHNLVKRTSDVGKVGEVRYRELEDIFRLPPNHLFCIRLEHICKVWRHNNLYIYTHSRTHTYICPNNPKTTIYPPNDEISRQRLHIPFSPPPLYSSLSLTQYHTHTHTHKLIYHTFTSVPVLRSRWARRPSP